MTKLVREDYPNLRAGSQASLVSYTVESIRAAREYRRSDDSFQPLVRELPDPRRVIQYAADQGNVNLTGYERRIKYSMNYRTRVTNQDTGVVTERENLVNVFSSSPLSAGEARERADAAARQQILFDSTSNRRLTREFLGVDFEAVYVTFGISGS